MVEIQREIETTISTNDGGIYYVLIEIIIQGYNDKECNVTWPGRRRDRI